MADKLVASLCDKVLPQFIPAGHGNEGNAHEGPLERVKHPLQEEREGNVKRPQGWQEESASEKQRNDSTGCHSGVGSQDTSVLQRPRNRNHRSKCLGCVSGTPPPPHSDPLGNKIAAALPKRGAPRKSGVWDHFRVSEDRREAECLLCGVTVKRGKDLGHLTSSGMKSHLKFHHRAVVVAEMEAGELPLSNRPPCFPQLHSLVPDKDKRGAEASKIPSLMRQQQHLQATADELGWWGQKPKEGRHPSSTSITRRVGELVALQDLPLSFVEGIAFRRLMALVAPRYSVPSPATFSQTVLPWLYFGVRKLLQEHLVSAEGCTVHFTGNVWSSPSGQHAYLSFTAHWWQVDEVGTDCVGAGHRWALLHAQVMDRDHSSGDILEAANAMLEGWISEAPVTKGFFVTNNGASLLEAMREGNFTSIPCAAHTLHLVVQGALARVGSTIASLIETCKKISGHFHRSVKGSELLRQCQEEAGAQQRCLVQDTALGWTSTFDTLEQILEQRDVLHEMAREHDIGVAVAPSWSQWTMIAQVVYVLRPFKEATVAFRGAMATLSQVIPVIRLLQDKMASLVKQQKEKTGELQVSLEVAALAAKLQAQLEEHFGPLMHQEEYVLATMCDPRLKGNIAVRCGTFAHTKVRLVERVRGEVKGRKEGQGGDEAGSAQSTCRREEPDSPPGSRGSVPQQPSSEQALWLQAIGAVSAGAPTRAPRERDSAESEVECYLDEPLENANSDPLIYWARKGLVWPGLARVALGLLSCPPTSVPSERVFPVVGDAGSPHSSWMAPGLVEQLVFLKVNLPLLGFPMLPCDLA